jgi:hypothetical protein
LPIVGVGLPTVGVASPTAGAGSPLLLLTTTGRKTTSAGLLPAASAQREGEGEPTSREALFTGISAAARTQPDHCERLAIPRIKPRIKRVLKSLWRRVFDFIDIGLYSFLKIIFAGYADYFLINHISVNKR